MDRIKVKFKKASPYSEYGYYETGETGDVMGFTQGCVIILKGDGSFVKAEPNWIEEVKDHTFPELAESEDERIRKALKEFFINSFQNNGVAAILGVHIKDILAWLEKQKEPKYLDTSTCEPWSDEQTRRNLINFLKGLGATEIPQTNRNRYLSYLEKQGEQKPVVQSEPIDFERELTNIIFTNTSSDELSTEKVIELGHKIYKEVLDAAQKEIRQKPEWSEEDESLRRRCIGAIDMANLSDYTKDDLLNWLKSLRPQRYWKPSEEQMEALQVVIEYGVAVPDREASLAEKHLEELLAQLRAL